MSTSLTKMKPRSALICFAEEGGGFEEKKRVARARLHHAIVVGQREHAAARGRVARHRRHRGEGEGQQPRKQQVECLFLAGDFFWRF